MKRTSFAFIACAVLAAFIGGVPSPTMAAWNIEPIAERVNGNGDTELDYDLSGNASVVYKIVDDLVFTQRIGTTWSAPETVVSGWWTVDSHRFVYSSTGVAGLIFGGKITRNAKPQIALVEKSGGSWGTVQTVIQGRNLSTARNSISLAYDGAGNPAVAYRKQLDVYLARRNGSTWSHANVAPSLFSGGKKRLSLAFDPSDGQPAVTFSTGGPDIPSNVYYSKFNGSSWVTEIAVDWPDAEQVDEVRLAFSPLTGKPFNFSFHGTLQPTPVMYVTMSEQIAPGSWIDTTIGPGFFPSNIAFDAAGEAHVMFSDSTATKLLYAKRTIAGFWTFPTVVDSIPIPECDPFTNCPERMLEASVKIDGTGKPTAAYAKVILGEVNPIDHRFATPGAACVAHGDCDDLNSCTDDICLPSGDCQYTPHADDTSCTGGICCAAVCVIAVCQNDAGCDDSDICTDDSCSAPGTCAAACDFVVDESNDPSCWCVPTHSKEKGPRCHDGLDNDCDGLIDSDDPDCQR